MSMYVFHFEESPSHKHSLLVTDGDSDSVLHTTVHGLNLIHLFFSLLEGTLQLILDFSLFLKADVGLFLVLLGLLGQRQDACLALVSASSDNLDRRV